MKKQQEYSGYRNVCLIVEASAPEEPFRNVKTAALHRVFKSGGNP
jgi:hypothetical protein